MRRLRLGTTGLAMALTLMMPRAASAGMAEVVDYIIGLTGPSMWGTPIDCELNLQSHERACFISGIPFADVDDGYLEARRLWLSLGGAAWISSGVNSDMREFKFLQVGMLSLEPMLHYRTFKTGSNKFFIEHGIGGSLFYLFGEDPDERSFKPFLKGGIKVKPVAITWRNIIVKGRPWDFGVAYNLRIFPSAFTAQDFGADPGTTTHSGRELAHGFAFTFGRSTTRIARVQGP